MPKKLVILANFDAPLAGTTNTLKMLNVLCKNENIKMEGWGWGERLNMFSKHCLPYNQQTEFKALQTRPVTAEFKSCFFQRKKFNWVVQIVPQTDPDLQEIIVKHKLFQKCIMVKWV
jgi:hypothetical protein